MNNLTVAPYVSLLRDGKILAYPTEAVWGLGCDPFNEAAVGRLLELKQRPVSKGLILVAADEGQITPLISRLEPVMQARLSESWPGPVTWLIPDPQNLYPRWIKGEHESVAIRVSAHPIIFALCSVFGGPLVSTSANNAGEPEIRSRLKIAEVFGSSIDAVVEGELGDQAQPSEIRDLLSGEVLR